MKPAGRGIIRCSKAFSEPVLTRPRHGVATLSHPMGEGGPVIAGPGDGVPLASWSPGAPVSSEGENLPEPFCAAQAAAGCHAGGVPYISRGLRSAERDDTPGADTRRFRTRKGCRIGPFPFGTRRGSATLPGSSALLHSYRGFSLTLQSPANIQQPSGLTPGADQLHKSPVHGSHALRFPGWEPSQYSITPALR
jgi:hypothetical protein